MACFLLVQTDLPERYISATKSYAMSNTEVSTIFEVKSSPPLATVMHTRDAFQVAVVINDYWTTADRSRCTLRL